jgi:hypothetical protein
MGYRPGQAAPFDCSALKSLAALAYDDINSFPQ